MRLIVYKYLFLFVMYFGMSAMSVSVLAIEGRINEPQWMSDGLYEDAEMLEFHINDKVWIHHREGGVGRIFGLIDFYEDGMVDFEIDPDFYRAGRFLFSEDVTQIARDFITETGLPMPVILLDKDIVDLFLFRPGGYFSRVALFEQRIPERVLFLVIDPAQLFINRGCLRHSNLRINSHLTNTFTRLSKPKRKVCVGDHVEIDSVEDQSFSVSAVSPYSGRISLESDSGSTIIVQAGDVAKIPGFYERWWCNGLARSLDYKTRGC